MSGRPERRTRESCGGRRPPECRCPRHPAAWTCLCSDLRFEAFGLPGLPCCPKRNRCPLGILSVAVVPRASGRPASCAGPVSHGLAAHSPALGGLAGSQRRGMWREGLELSSTAAVSSHVPGASHAAPGTCFPSVNGTAQASGWDGGEAAGSPSTSPCHEQGLLCGPGPSVLCCCQGAPFSGGNGIMCSLQTVLGEAGGHTGHGHWDSCFGTTCVNWLPCYHQMRI